jgi:predicted transcriptional regulator
MDKKQKEALVLALAEKGKTYREITKEAGVSPNTIKAVLNRAGLDESASISSRAFELYVQQKTPLEIAIELNIEADKAIHYYHEYFKLLGITEFTRVYLRIKDNPWPYVNLATLVHNARMSDSEVVELLMVANRYLPRVRLEYDRLQEEINSTKAELNSWKAEIGNAVRTYQDFCDRNLALKNREDELQLSINELEAKKAELHMTTTEPEQQLSELRESNAGNDNLNLGIKQEEVIFTNDVFIPPSNMAIDYHPNENETLLPQVDSSSRTIIFDTKDLFPKKAQT